MKRKTIDRGFLAVLGCAVALMAGCSTTPAAAKAKAPDKADEAAKPAAAAPTAADAKTVPAPPPPVAPETTAWNGSGPTETKPFLASAPEWHIQYSTKPEAAHPDRAVEFQVYVHRADSGKIVALAANIKGAAEGDAAVRTAPGEYYLRIYASAPWNVAVTGLR